MLLFRWSRSPTSKSSWPFNDPLVNVTKTPITISIIVTFIFHNFIRFPYKFEVLILLFNFFQFYTLVNRFRKVYNLQVLIFFCWSILYVVFWPRLGDLFVCQIPIRGWMCHSPWQLLACVYTICSYCQIKISCKSSSGSPCPPSCA